MRSVNKVILIGNLTRDPELKSTQSGQAICTLGLATNREWTGQDNERKSSTEFHEVVAWARRAEVCHQILKKGNLVYIEGYLKTRSWEGDDGKKRFRTEVVVDDIIKLEKRSQSDTVEEFSSEEKNSEEETVSPSPGEKNGEEMSDAIDVFNDVTPAKEESTDKPKPSEENPII